MDSFRMPILGKKDAVVWYPTSEDREQAMENHDQTLERLRERGGLAWEELDAVLAHERYHDHKRDETSSAQRVHLILKQRAESDAAAADVISALRSEQGWRDIASAPKDGTMILALNEHTGDMAVVGWTEGGRLDTDDEDALLDDCWTDIGNRNAAASFAFNENYFQYWQPLPSRPLEAGKERT